MLLKTPSVAMLETSAKLLSLELVVGLLTVERLIAAEDKVELSLLAEIPDELP
jgi:hypothetical protein